MLRSPRHEAAAASGSVSFVALTGPVEFVISGSPITGAGTLDFQFVSPVLVAHGGTGMGSFAANSIIIAGPTSTAPFTSKVFPGSSSTFLDGSGNFSIPPTPAAGTGTVTSVALTAPPEFSISGSPVTGSGTLDFQFLSPAMVAHGGTGFGSFAANSLIMAGPTSTAHFTSKVFPGLSSTYLDGSGNFSAPPAQPVFPGTSSTFLNGQGAFTIPPLPSAGAGTVTSVALQLSPEFVVNGSPVTGAGTLMGSFAFQSANFFFAGPASGAAITPGFRAMLNADIPVGISGKNLSSTTYANPSITSQALTDAASVLWNMNSGSVASLTIAASRTLSTPANLPNQGTAILKLTHNGTNLVFTYAAAFKFATNRTLPTLSSCPGQVDILSFFMDGTNLYGTGLTNLK